uniref:Uncharacterized protein n=1 Tax=Rhizophora mucronata TaxID=61149 RepID=A0A2P2JP63_RHIMU
MGTRNRDFYQQRTRTIICKRLTRRKRLHTMIKNEEDQWREDK